ncbi:glycosyltransferase family 4 protein [Mucilaginibacter puniceus]
MPHKILLITSGQPSLNPRLVKEADALANANYEVTVLYAYWNDWGTKFDEEQLPDKKWKAIRVGGDPVQKPSIFLLSRILHKAAKSLYKSTGIQFLAEPAATRSTYFLIQEAKNHKADLYIGHNLGALPAAVIAAKKHKAKCGFDAEDFHRQEVSDDVNSLHYKLTKYIEDKYLIQTDYITASSPLITSEYKLLYPNTNIATILNVFPKSTDVDVKSTNKKGPVKLIWFSQTVGKKRGIENIIKALQLLNKSFELHLLGNASDTIKTEFVDLAQNTAKSLFFHPPIAPDKLVEFISQFDIGLACETGFSLNNTMALSNKIFTYLQAGLAILSSDIPSQKQLVEQNPGIGSVYENNNIDSLISILSEYEANREMLIHKRQAALKLGQEKYNWENESRVFLNIVNKTLNN